MVNRATKRLLAKQEKKDQGAKAPRNREEAVAERRTTLERKKRTPPRQFLREVRGELKKVAWPSRREVATYTVVVLVSVIFITAIVFALDYGFNQAIFQTFSK
ncbi:MAG TPA: preprotein translocase subunit SecE [Actinomycetota bacterium]